MLKHPNRCCKREKSGLKIRLESKQEEEITEASVIEADVHESPADRRRRSRRAAPALTFQNRLCGGRAAAPVKRTSPGRRSRSDGAAAALTPQSRRWLSTYSSIASLFLFLVFQNRHKDKNSESTGNEKSKSRSRYKLLFWLIKSPPPFQNHTTFRASVFYGRRKHL